MSTLLPPPSDRDTPMTSSVESPTTTGLASASSANGAASETRIASMDQFRGYAVAGMFVVNFLGGLAVTHQFLKHNNTHFSWADSIMPAFMFACGFSYRLSVLKRIPRKGRVRTYAGIVRRSLALVLVSLVMYGLGGSFGSWSEMTDAGIREFVAELLKADLWEVLAIIGVTQLLLMPVIEMPAKVRFALAVGFSLGHILLSWSFNYWFVYGEPNWMDAWWGAAGRRAWDGGVFGIISWAIPMLAGTLVYDLLISRTPRSSVRPLLRWGIVLMSLGYAASCLTRLYDVSESEPSAVAADGKFAASPVVPPLENAKGRPLTSLLAEPPFVPPPGVDERKLNYWMMDKRVVTQSFVWFATGFSCLVFALFVLVCDVWGVKSSLLALFGRHALAAYVIHYPVEQMVRQVVPRDSPVWWASLGLAVFFAITWMIVRYLDHSRITIRL